jgi:hypothetical protein
LIGFKSLSKKNLPEGRDSLQEVYFEWWLEELINSGFVIRYERSSRYKLIDSVFSDKLSFKPIKKDPIRHLIIQREFLKSWTYEPDYDVYWSEKSYNFLFQNIDFLNLVNFKTLFYAKRVNNEWLTVIDIKPKSFRGGSMSSSVKFPLIQKMMYLIHDVYVHKISPLDLGGLFDKTFTPRRYLFQDRRMVNRKISKWVPRKIETFIKENFEDI